PSAPYDPDLVVTNCTFRISHDGISDVCSIAEVTVTLVDGNGAVVTNYTGTVNLNTTTNYGTWVDIGDGFGALTDPVSEDGSATYKFELDDEGSVVLGLRHTTASGTVNIDVSDGLSQ